MSILYDPALDKAAYLMCQHMTQTMLSELHPSLLPAAKSRKTLQIGRFQRAERLGVLPWHLWACPWQTFRFLRAFCADHFHHRSSGCRARMVLFGGRMWLPMCSVQKSHLVWTWDQVACLVSVTDQGPNIIGATNYLQYSPSALMFLALWDPFHRAWNDLKGAMKASKSGAWRTVLELTLVANLNYGPFSSSAWHYKKKARLEDFCATRNCSDELWVKYQHLICKERRMQEPSSFDDCQALFETLHTLDSFNTKGPLIKLMRWLSWFESHGLLPGGALDDQNGPGIWLGLLGAGV